MSAPHVLAILSKPSDFVALSADLAPLGLAVSHAESLLDATLRQVASPAQLIVCDAEAVDWLQALWVFQRLNTPPAVVFLTRRADEELWLEMLQAGAFDLLTKPYQAHDLRWVVSSALNPPTKWQAGIA